MKYITLLLCLIISVSIISQNPEPEIKSKAEKTFNKEDYVEASKLYAHLLTFNQTDPFYNYRYGICLLYNSPKKSDCIKHLTFASKVEGFDPEVFFYLGKAYHLDYRFKEAINYYNLYKTKVGSKLNKDLDVNRNIAMSENGFRLLSSSNEVIVLDKQEIEIPSFFRIYDLKDIGGNIIVTAQFQSKIDKKRNHTPLIHFPSNPKRIFYSSYGEDENNGKDIYMRQRLPDGTWSLQQKVPGKVNTASDEDFPYISPKGNFLYFSSKGHNSMGGYDIFRAKYNPETNEFDEPENLDFPISSPDNDLFYVVDSLEKNANFASSRQSLDGKMHVYQVKVEKIPIQFVVVKSFFNSTINPENKKVSVEVFEYASSKKIGTFNSSSKGAVLITFPKGGKYEYVITVDGSNKNFRQLINIPFLKQFRPLKQKIIHENDANNQETIVIQNFFDEELEDGFEVIREVAMKRSEMNPNFEQFDLESLAIKVDNKEIYSKLGMEKLNDNEVINKLEELVNIQEKKTEDLEKIKETSLSQSMVNIKNIGSLEENLKSTVSLANTKSGNDRKESFEKAGEIVNEMNFLEDYSEKLINTADSLSEIIEKNKVEISKYKVIVDELNKLFSSGNMSGFGKKLNEDLSSLQALQKENPEFVIPSLFSQVMAQHEEMNRIEQKILEIKEKNVMFISDIEKLKKEEANSKGKEKSEIQKKIEEKKNIQLTFENEIKAQQMKLVEANNQLLKMEESLAYFQDILNSTPPKSNTNSNNVSKALKDLDNANTRTLKTYVEQQLKEFGVDIKSLTPESEKKKIEKQKDRKTYARDLSYLNEDLLADNSVSNNNENAEIKELKNNKSDSKTKNNSDDNTKISDNTTINKSVDSNISNDKINKSSNEAKSNSNDDFNKTISKTSNDKSTNSVENNETKNINQTSVNNDINFNNSLSTSTTKDNPIYDNNNNKKENISVNFLTEIDTNKLKSNLNPKVFEEKIEELNSVSTQNKSLIDANQNLTGGQIEKAKIRQDKKTIVLLDKDIQRLKIITSNNPENQEAKESLLLLENKKKVIEDQVVSKEKELESKFPDLYKTTAWNEEQIIEMFNPSLNKEVQTITNNKTFSDYTKSKLLTNISQKIIEELSLDKEVIRKELSKTPHIQELKNELNMVDVLVKSTEFKKSENDRFVSDYKIKETLKSLGSIEDEQVNSDLLKINPTVLKYRKELLKENIGFISLTANSQNDLNIQSNIISNYYNALSDKIYDLEKKQSLSKKDTSLISEIKILNQELELTRKKLDEIEQKSDEIDKQVISENYVTLNNEIKFLKQEDNEFKLQINDPNTSKKDKKELIEKRAENLGKQVETYEKVNSLQTAILSKYPPNKIRNKKLAKQAQNVLDSLAYERFKLNDSEIREGLSEFKETKNAAKAIKILPELIEKQEENSLIAQRLLYNSLMKKNLRQVINYSDDMYALESNKSIQKSKIKLKNAKEDAELALEKEKLALTKAKKKKKPIYIKKISNLKKEIDNITQIDKNLDYEILKRSNIDKELKKPLPKKQIIDISDENKMRSNPQYSSAKDLYSKRKIAIEGMKLLVDKLDDEKNRFNEAVVDYANDPNRKNKQYSSLTFENLKVTFKQYYELQNKFQNINNDYKTNTSSFHDIQLLEQLFEEDIEKQKREDELKNKNIEIEQVDMLAYEEKLTFENNIPSDGVYYQILIDKSDKMLSVKFLNNFSDLRAILKENGETEFYTSFLNSAVSAEKLLNDIKDFSYLNANIISYKDGKQIPFNEAKMITDGDYYRQLALNDIKPKKGKNKKSKNSYNKNSFNDVAIKNNDNNSLINDNKSSNGNNKVSRNDNLSSTILNNSSSNDSKTSNSDSKVSRNDNLSSTNFNSSSSNDSKTSNSDSKVTRNDNLSSTNLNNSSSNDSKTSNRDNIKESSKNVNIISNGKIDKYENLKNAVSIDDKKGLYFTVQVGAYFNKKYPSNLSGINPIFSKSFDGIIRYSTGIFHSVEEANPIKQQMYERGVTDAFITAYYNGQRITIAEAQKLLSEKGNTILEIK